jgi:hypothetical protein
MIRASDATGIAFVELLETLWGIEPGRFAGELRGLGEISGLDAPMRRLTRDERALVVDFVELLATRRARRPRRA